MISSISHFRQRKISEQRQGNHTAAVGPGQTRPSWTVFALFSAAAHAQIAVRWASPAPRWQLGAGVGVEAVAVGNTGVVDIGAAALVGVLGWV